MNICDMPFTGIAELDNARRNMITKINNAFDNMVRLINQQVRRDMNVTMYKMKSEILGVFQATAYEQFQLVFYKYYGKNYNVNAVNNSLSFYIDEKLYPHLSYKVENFIIEKDFAADERTFNQNARIEGSFDRLMDYEELEAMEDIDFFGLSFAENNPYDYATEDVAELDDYRVFQNRKILVEPKQIYQEAETATLEKFHYQFEKILKPAFAKKYKIFL